MIERRKSADSALPEPPTALQVLLETDEQAYETCLAAAVAARRKLDAVREELRQLRQALARFEALCHYRIGDLVGELRRLAQAVSEARTDLQRQVSADNREDDTVIEALLDELDVDIDLEFDEADPAANDPPPDDQRTVNPMPSRPAPKSDRAALKRLYRALAKRCHPDLAIDAADRGRRVMLMQRINEAFRAGDVAELKSLLQETESDDTAFAQRTLAERLLWARQELARLDRELELLRAESVQIHASDLYRLWRRFEAGEAVFDLLERDFERRIRQEGDRLDRLTAARRRLRGEAGMDRQRSPLATS